MYQSPINEIVLTVSDNGGNTSSCSAVVTVKNDALPLALCKDITVHLDDTGNAAFTAADVDDGSYSCNMFGLTLDILSVSCADIGPNTVTLTLLDSQGDSATCLATVTVLDTLAATALAQMSKVASPDRAEGDEHGRDVDINGMFAVTGARYEDEDSTGLGTKIDAGSAFIHTQDSVGNWMITAKLVAEDREAGDQFGKSVGIYNQYAVVGAPFEDHDSVGMGMLSGAGAVYVFKNDGNGGWEQTAKLVPEDRGPNDQFGYDVAIYEEVIAIGAFLEDDDPMGVNTLSDAGSIYIFEKDSIGEGWAQTQKLVADDRDVGDFFGWSVDLTYNQLIVGAILEDEDSTGVNTISDAGAAYLFERTDSTLWQQTAKLVPADRDSSDQFGYSVAINDGYAVIGAIFEDEDVDGVNTLPDAGAAYVFNRDTNGGWTEAAKLVPAIRAVSDQFGVSVDIVQGQIAVGAFSEDQDANNTNTLVNAGAVYVYTQFTDTTWVQSQKIVAHDRGAFDLFGFSLTLSGSDLIVGAINDSENVAGLDTLEDSGSVYFFAYQCAGPGDIIYVDSSKTTGMQTGWDWDNACLSLTHALELATQFPNVAEIWMADGYYFTDTSVQRSASFEVGRYLSIYGGFAGDELVRTARDPELNQTILSGDIGVAGDSTDNAYHVVTVGPNVQGVLIDGVAISEGNADGMSANQDFAGGVLNRGVLHLNNVTIRDNASTSTGSAVVNDGLGVFLILEQCTIETNNPPEALRNLNGAKVVLRKDNVVRD